VVKEIPAHFGAAVAAVVSAVPAPAIDQQRLWDDCFGARYAGDERAGRIWRSAGVQTRYAVVDPCSEDVSTWTTGERMQRFLSEALPLGKDAVSAALGEAGISASEVGLFAVASCTGYATPGLDILLARDLAMSASVQRLSIGHMGCYAALPGLGAVADFVATRHRPAVLLCCELTSLHVQPPSESMLAGRLGLDDVEQVVAHALFSDAAAAAVVLPGGPGLEVVDVQARTDATASDLMTWQVTDLGFRMGLSPRIPDVVARHVRPLVDDLLSQQGIQIGDVAGWAVHPGGPRILDVVLDRLGLDEAAIGASRETLRDSGNSSSATILLVLQRLMRQRNLGAGDWVVMLAFGPGLTLYGVLLRVVD
jgi:predicted naringenin-chalcone synthase